RVASGCAPLPAWRDALAKRSAASRDVTSELLEGASLLRRAAERARAADRNWLSEQARMIGGSGEMTVRTSAALAQELAACVARHPDRTAESRYDHVLHVTVDRERAEVGAWYEMFPRSAPAAPRRAGGLPDVGA